MNCRICGSEDLTVFVDLGSMPLANRLLTADQLDEPVATFPLRPMLCGECYLVQLPEVVKPEDVFVDYPYFSSQSETFVKCARLFAENSIGRFDLEHAPSLVVEVASNDGYLLQHFMSEGVRCYGVEPARNVAEYAITQGIPTMIEFFTPSLVKDKLLGDKADLIVANNVLAHVPDLHKFLWGVRMLLAPEGAFTIEVPSLVGLVDGAQVGQIYHEHFSYFLLSNLERVLGMTAIPLRIFDIDWLSLHGGSMRVYACHKNASYSESASVEVYRDAEKGWASTELGSFTEVPAALKRSLWSFLLRQNGRKIAGYCAAAKASTILNYCGIGPDFIPYIADTTPAKQGLHMGRIPIVSPDHLQEDKPDVIWVMAANWINEVLPKLRNQCPWATIVWLEGLDVRTDMP